MGDYLIVRADTASWADLARFLAYGGSEEKVLETSRMGLLEERGTDVSALSRDHRWFIVVSIVVRRIITFLRKPMELCGLVLEFFLNLLDVNGGDLIGLLRNLVTWKVVLPERGSDSYLSIIGHIDTRLDLYKFHHQSALEEIRELEGKALLDLCVMASKLAYENANVVQNAVENRWKMHFVEFYNCWNEYQKERSTQVFIMCDKRQDADIILISFRGTEPFDADDWCTDIDYSWCQIPQMGKIHMGFLEALGLGTRDQISTIQLSLQDPNSISENRDKRNAYYTVRNKLRSLLKMHPRAKFIVTGHSLGGALAILFPAILLFHKETELMERLLAVYTFGQPRVGDAQLKRFMEAHVCHPVNKYFRVVYCNDVIPRIPYDDRMFLYKHFGVCRYYDCLFVEKNMNEEPDRNFFGIKYIIPKYLIAVWEIIRGLCMGYIFGAEYKETWVSTFFTVLGLVMPGISAHCPTNYVNCVRLGKKSWN
ncbi:Lipase [Carex littledalei]|uniref:Lipase n=1 Tax=Carex littledalei TaxID=544730 RepID=A0A833VL52_9POAL|nr:Lipase [Carex littledalei]